MERIQTSQSFDAMDVAIVGMAGRFPAAKNVSELWKLLIDGRCALQRLTRNELIASGVAAGQVDDPDYVAACMPLDDADCFDAETFGITPREAANMDPQHRHFLECAWEALEDAAIDWKRYSGCVGVFGGAGTNTHAVARLLKASSSLAEFTQAVIDTGKDSLVTRVSYRLGLSGPSVAVQTACSSSLVAVHMACQSLLNFECDAALAGGVSIATHQRYGFTYERGGIGSPDGYCRAFDEHANGSMAGNGVGIVCLKRLKDATDAGDHVYAVIKGSAINNDGSDKVGFTAPSITGQVDVISRALSVAQVEPQQIGLIEAHGTGTKLGDSIELAALLQVFGAAPRPQSCAIGSIKSNIGHLDAAAGVAGLIKAALCLKHRVLVPSLHVTEPAQVLRAGSAPLRVSSTTCAWVQERGPRRASISSFGIGGTNAHVVLEEPPHVSSVADESIQPHIFPLSGFSAEAVHSLRERLAVHLSGDHGLSLGSVARTLQVGRRELPFRQYVVGRSLSEVRDALAKAGAVVKPESFDRPLVIEVPSLLSVSTDVLARWYLFEPRFRDTAKSVLEELSPPLRDELTTALDLNSTSHGLAGVRELTCAGKFVLAVLYLRMWRDLGLTSKHALCSDTFGEMTWLCASGRLDLAEGIRACSSEFQNLPPAVERVRRSSGLADIVHTTHRQHAFAGLRQLLVLNLEAGAEPGRAVSRDTWNHVECFVPPPPGPDRSSLLETIGHLWSKGVHVDWSALNSGSIAHRVSLPTYPFSKTTHRSTEASLVGAAPSSCDEWFFVPSWTRRGMVDVLPRFESAKRGICVVFADDSAFCERLCAVLRTHCERVVRVTAGDRLSGLGTDDSTIDACDPLHLDAFWSQFSPHVEIAVVYCWSAETVGPCTGEQVRTHAKNLVTFAGALARCNRSIKLSVITTAAVALTPCEPIVPEQAAFAAICRVLQQEHDGIRACVIDVSADMLSQCTSWSIERLALRILSTWRYFELAVRGSEHFRRHYEQHLLPEAVPHEVLQPGLYLITGGLGGIALDIGEMLLQQEGVKLLLLARGESADLRARLKQLKPHWETGGADQRVTVAAADVADEHEVADALKVAEQLLGALVGVIHLAAETRHSSIRGEIGALGLGDMELQMRPKALGLRTLMSVLHGRSLNFRAVFSSNSSAFGGIAHGAYSASNAVTEAIAAAHNSRHPEERWHCISWDGWVTSRRTDLIASADPFALDSRQGFGALLRVLRTSATSVMVSKGDVEQRLSTWVNSRSSKSGAGQAHSASGERDESEKPRTDIERAIARAIESVLGVGAISVRDNFLKLGGDSLLAVRVCNRLRTQFGVALAPTVLLGPAPTVGAVAVELVSALMTNVDQPVMSES